MIRKIIHRLLSTIPVLIGVSVVVFLMIHLVPGDVAEVILGPGATQEALAELRRSLHLNDPFYLQYYRWLKTILSGDLGTSVAFSIPVETLLIERLRNSAILIAGAIFLSVLLGVSGGLVAALLQNTVFDRTVLLVSLVLASVPVFWLGIVLVYYFSVNLGWLPASGMYSFGGDPTWWGLFIHLILPALTAAAVPLAVITRLIRSEALQVLQQQYVTALKAKGLGEIRILFVHVLRNILPQTLNIIGLQIGYLLGGAILTEIIFSWPGLGQLIYSAILARDIPLIQASVLTVGGIFVLINAFTDVLGMMIDPKSRAA